MCRWGDTVPVEVLVAASISHTGAERRDMLQIDRCIAPIVAALDAGGVRMLGSCCGHGDRWGEIVLADGRKLYIAAVGRDSPWLSHGHH